MNLNRLSLNQATVEQLGLVEFVERCAREGIPAVGLWRHKVAEVGQQRVAKMVREAGVRVTSLCRGGMFTGSTVASRRAALDDNRRAIDEAAAFGADTLILVCGPPCGRELAAARVHIREAIWTLEPYAAARQVRLGIEPLHPMMVGERSAMVSLPEATAICHEFGSPWVGVVVDAYHIWWHPDVLTHIQEAAGHIVGVQVSDWLVPTTSVLAGRGVMGEGIIPLRPLARAVEEAGYDGPVEVEILNPDVWARPLDQLFGQIRRGFVKWL